MVKAFATLSDETIDEVVFIRGIDRRNHLKRLPAWEAVLSPPKIAPRAKPAVEWLAVDQRDEWHRIVEVRNRHRNMVKPFDEGAKPSGKFRTTRHAGVDIRRSYHCRIIESDTVSSR